MSQRPVLAKAPARTESKRRKAPLIVKEGPPKAVPPPSIPRPEIAKAAPPNVLAPDSALAQEIRQLESDTFDADTFVQNKCKGMSEKVNDEHPSLQRMCQSLFTPSVSMIVIIEIFSHLSIVPIPPVPQKALL